MRTSSLRPYRHGAFAVLGAVAGIVGLALIETIPASAQGQHDVAAATEVLAIETPAIQVTESFARLVSNTKITQVAPLTAKTVSPKSEGVDIESLETRLRWAATTKQTPDSEWDTATTAAVKLFQAKNKIPASGIADTKTIKRLNEVAGTNKLHPRCYEPGIRICVDKSQKVARYLKDGEVLKEINVNIGPELGDKKFGQYSSTRIGINKIGQKDVDAVSTLYGYPMPYWMQFDGGIGFHYSEYFSQSGYSDTSMGCVIIGTKEEAAWLFKNTPMNTTVVVYK